MTKKTQILYSVISVCAIIAYCGFLVKNSIAEVDIAEETVPYEYEAELPPEVFVTEPIAPVTKIEQFVTIEEPTIAPTESVSEPDGFSPVYPAKGNVTKVFSLKHAYNEQTGDWRSHNGIDITASVADPVYAVEDGTVIACYEDPLWGNIIEIDHGEYISVYKNLSTLIMVKTGDMVARGEKISGVGEGSIAESVAPHIHFELYHFGESVDPLTLLE